MRDDVYVAHDCDTKLLRITGQWSVALKQSATRLSLIPSNSSSASTL